MQIHQSNWSKYNYLEFKDKNMTTIILGNIPNTKSEDFDFNFNIELYFENCTFTYFEASCLFLEKKLTFKNCKFDRFSTYATYFFEGLTMINCEIKQEASFSCGGHNNPPHKIIIDKCIFYDFVDFFDVWFRGDVQITHNIFKKGTNLITDINPPEKEMTFDIKNNDFGIT